MLLQIRQRLPPEDFWIKVVENLIAAHTQFFLRKTNYWASMNARDAQMARNLDWLCRVKYPQEKIIVWAHNYHISKFAGQAKEDFLQAARPMGAVFTADSAHRSNTYILGFTSHSGKAGRLGQKTFNIDKPGKNSLETWFRSDWEYGFVDFVGYNADCLPEQADWFSLKGSVIGKHFNHTAQWSRIFDGVFYLKKMYPCRQVRE
ncbi:MAG: erythromycin esterase family protein [Saprospiraceae bacterium]|nr:erythromycin esterase family protein [Saprospiraceae bacterium]